MEGPNRKILARLFWSLLAAGLGGGVVLVVSFYVLIPPPSWPSVTGDADYTWRLAVAHLGVNFLAPVSSIAAGIWTWRDRKALGK